MNPFWRKCSICHHLSINYPNSNSSTNKIEHPTPMTLNIFPSWYDTIMDYMICVGWWIHLLHNSFSTCERVCIGRGLRNDIKKVHVNGRIKEHVNLLIFIKWKSHFFEEQACLKTSCMVIILRYWCNIRISGGRETVVKLMGI